MNLLEQQHLLAERTTVQRLLQDIPGDDVLERSSLEARLDDLNEKLSLTLPPSREPARARLVFGGKPVVGQYGIFAEFGAKATSLFTDAVSKVAAGLSGPLAAMGPVPNRDQSQLLITGTALGSFGFVLEEHRPEQPLITDETTTAQALELTRNLLESTLGTDDELADAAANTDQRAVVAIRWFLDVLAANEAVCTLEFREHVFRFPDVGAVRRSLTRLSQENLREEETQLNGEFQGVLPKRRTFEFKLAATEEVIRGNVGPAIANPDVINEHLHQGTTIKVLATRVGNGRPRYVLSELPNWPSGA